MLQSGWLWFALLTLGPLLGGLLVDRLRLGTVASIATMLVVLAGASALLVRVGRPAASATMASIATRPVETGSATSGTTPPAVASAEIAERQAEIERLRQETAALRTQIATVESARTATLAARAEADSQLENARSALAAARSELGAVRGHLADLEGSVIKSDAAKALAKAEADLEALHSAHAAALADIADLRARLAAATPPPTAAGTPAPAPAAGADPAAAPQAPLEAPAPFSHTVAREAVTAAAAPHPPGAANALRDSLAAGLTTPGFTLSALPQAELVQGRHGRYYRVACRGNGASKRLEFEPGGYNLVNGDSSVEACARSLQTAVLAGLPKDVVHALFVQGFASAQGFARPVPLAAGDAQLKSVPYLPHGPGKQHFEGKPKVQSIASAYGNKELPILRAAYVVDVIDQATKGASKPIVLDGEIRPNGDAASRSFDIVIFVAW